MNKDPRYVPEDSRESALGLRTVGWVLLTVDLLVVCMFVFISIRVGAWLFQPALQTVQTARPAWGLFDCGIRVSTCIEKMRAGNFSPPLVLLLTVNC